MNHRWWFNVICGCEWMFWRIFGGYESILWMWLWGTELIKHVCEHTNLVRISWKFKDYFMTNLEKYWLEACVQVRLGFIDHLLETAAFPDRHSLQNSTTQNIKTPSDTNLFKFSYIWYPTLHTTKASNTIIKKNEPDIHNLWLKRRNQFFIIIHRISFTHENLLSLHEPSARSYFPFLLYSFLSFWALYTKEA